LVDGKNSKAIDPGREPAMLEGSAERTASAIRFVFVRWQFGSSISFGFGRHAIVTGDRRGDQELSWRLAAGWVRVRCFGNHFIQQTEKASSEVSETSMLLWDLFGGISAV